VSKETGSSSERLTKPDSKRKRTGVTQRTGLTEKELEDLSSRIKEGGTILSPSVIEKRKLTELMTSLVDDKGGDAAMAQILADASAASAASSKETAAMIVEGLKGVAQIVTNSFGTPRPHPTQTNNRCTDVAIESLPIKTIEDFFEALGFRDPAKQASVIEATGFTLESSFLDFMHSFREHIDGKPVAFLKECGFKLADAVSVNTFIQARFPTV